MISVAMASYNGEKYIEQQLDSIFNQSKKIDELIITDDCSTDNTVFVIEEYIKMLNISKELCELLIEIVSDSENKPYLGNYIDELKSDSEFIYAKKR